MSELTSPHSPVSRDDTTMDPRQDQTLAQQTHVSSPLVSQLVASGDVRSPDAAPAAGVPLATFPVVSTEPSARPIRPNLRLGRLAGSEGPDIGTPQSIDLGRVPRVAPLLRATWAGAPQWPLDSRAVYCGDLNGDGLDEVLVLSEGDSVLSLLCPTSDASSSSAAPTTALTATVTPPRGSSSVLPQPQQAGPLPLARIITMRLPGMSFASVVVSARALYAVFAEGTVVCIPLTSLFPPLICAVGGSLTSPVQSQGLTTPPLAPGGSSHNGSAGAASLPRAAITSPDTHQQQRAAGVTTSPPISASAPPVAGMGSPAASGVAAGPIAVPATMISLPPPPAHATHTLLQRPQSYSSVPPLDVESLPSQAEYEAALSQLAGGTAVGGGMNPSHSTSSSLSMILPGQQPPPVAPFASGPSSGGVRGGGAVPSVSILPHHIDLDLSGPDAADMPTFDVPCGCTCAAVDAADAHLFVGTSGGGVYCFHVPTRARVGTLRLESEVVSISHVTVNGGEVAASPIRGSNSAADAAPSGVMPPISSPDGSVAGSGSAAQQVKGTAGVATPPLAPLPVAARSVTPLPPQAPPHAHAAYGMLVVATLQRVALLRLRPPCGWIATLASAEAAAAATTQAAATTGGCGSGAAALPPLSRLLPLVAPCVLEQLPPSCVVWARPVRLIATDTQAGAGRGVHDDGGDGCVLSDASPARSGQFLLHEGHHHGVLGYGTPRLPDATAGHSPGRTLDHRGSRRRGGSAEPTMGQSWAAAVVAGGGTVMVDAAALSPTSIGWAVATDNGSIAVYKWDALTDAVSPMWRLDGVAAGAAASTGGVIIANCAGAGGIGGGPPAASVALASMALMVGADGEPLVAVLRRWGESVFVCDSKKRCLRVATGGTVDVPVMSCAIARRGVHARPASAAAGSAAGRDASGSLRAAVVSSDGVRLLESPAPDRL